MSRYISLLIIAVSFLALSSCSGLSREGKKIAGKYIIPEISQNEPIMELNRDATCLVRAIKPGVLTYSVSGKWNVEKDSLIMWLDPATLQVSGDSSLVGNIPTKSARKIVEHNEFNLQLESGGITYYYKKI
ncbi:MAG: hypothetical protein K2K92_02100 [Duncaniella sp.]|nr:hypothetical protein [Duncaniella sp.]